MTTIVLCHGAWGGGWSWTGVADILRNQGHRVFVPTYTGLGERTHLASPDVDLSTHIHIFEKHKKLFVHKTDLSQNFSASDHTGSSNPIDIFLHRMPFV